MPTVLRVGKYRFFFFSNEGSEPIHIHVESGEDYAKFWLEPVELATSVGYRPSELRAIADTITQHTAIITTTWHAHFDQ